MKQFSILFVAAFLAVVVQLGHPASVNPQYVVDFNIQDDPEIANLTNAVVDFDAQVRAIDRAFDLESASLNATELRATLDQIKKLKAELNLVQANVHSELSSTQTRSFLNRLSLGLASMQADMYDDILKWIGLEIAAHLRVGYSFEQYLISEKLSLLFEQGIERFGQLMASALEAEKLLVEARKENDLTIDASTKSAVSSYFQTILQQAQQEKQQFAGGYYEESELIRLESNHELNLLQRIELENFIDMLNYVQDYVRKYQDLFLRF